VLRPVRTEPFALQPEAVAHYRQLLTDIKARGMKTFVTLFHFCLPSWLAEVGGWNNPLSVSEFSQYARAAAREFGDLVDYWLTLNEPLVYVYQGYVNGIWPPGFRRNYLLAFKTIRRLLEGHVAAYRAIHDEHPSAKVSYVVHWRPFVARNGLNPLDQVVRYFRDQVFNHIFPTAVETGDLQFPYPISTEREIKKISGPIPNLKGAIDFLAFNYFTREICEFRYSWPPDVFGIQSAVTRLATTGMGWEIFPEGLYYMLSEDIAAYRYDSNGQRREIFITENGMADAFSSDLNEGDWSLSDEQRVRYLVSHLVALQKAIGKGENIRGYLHWSLLDNFEWSDGLKPRFGLVRVAYPSQKRTLRKSAGVYAEIVARGGIGANLL
jgi:beta-glucosidase